MDNQSVNIIGIFLNNELRTGGHKRYLELMEVLALQVNRSGFAVQRQTEEKRAI